jgi:hypothetical protein
MALSARVTVQGQSVVLNAGDIGSLSKGIVFTLTQPTPLGSPQDFVKWINTTFGAGLPDLSSVAGSIPPPLDGAFTQFINGQVSLDTLIINQPLCQYQLGVSFTLPGAGVSLLSGLAFNGIGVLVTHQTPASKLTADIDDKVQSLSVTTGEGAQFKLPSGKPVNVKIDDEILTVSDAVADKLTVTRGQLNTKAAAHKTGATVVLMS